MDLGDKCPEWMELMGLVEFRDANNVDPVDNDGRRIYYNTRKMKRMSRDYQCFFIAQQLMHIQLAHAYRGEGLEPEPWRWAADAVVNELLADSGFVAPPKLLRLPEAKNASAEEVYRILLEKKGDLETPEEEESEEESQEEIIAKVEEDQQSKQATNDPGSERRDIDDPELAEAIAGLAELIEPSLQIDYDWFPGDTIRDGMLRERFKPYPVPHAEILLDTSASIDEELLLAFVRAVKGLMQEDAVVKVGCFDTQFYGFQEVASMKDIDNLEIRGAGGTNFETAINAFTGDSETNIIFTDGYAEMPLQRRDVIWLVYSDTPIDPPGGRVIYVKPPKEIEEDEIDFLIT